MRRVSGLMVLFTVSVLVIVGCNGGDSLTQNPRVINNTVAGWASGAADLVFSDFSRPGLTGVELARGTINADGQMDLTLPPTVGDEFFNFNFDEIFLLFPEECADSITISPNDVALLLVNTFLVERAGVPLGVLEQKELNMGEEVRDRSVFRFYTDIALRVEGACTTRGNDSETYAINASQGWSLMEVTHVSTCTENSSSCSETATTRTVTHTDVPWEFSACNGVLPDCGE